MHNKTIAITDCDHANINEELAVFESIGLACKLFQCKTEDDLIRELPDYRAAINQYAPFTERVFAALPDLKMVVRYGVGVNNIDLAAASSHGVAVCNVPDYGVQEVASHALALMMALTRKIVPMNEAVREGEWEYARSIPIYRYNTQTVGIVGLGRIGKCFASLARPLFGRVIAYDPAYDQASPNPSDFIEMVDFETLLRESDVVSIHCPLETACSLFGAVALAQMKPTAYLINVSRGGIVVEEDLAQALEAGVIAGAGLDVTSIEPVPMGSPLRACKNLLLTPHMAWYSEQASRDLKTKAAEEAARFLQGQPLRNQLNRF